MIYLRNALVWILLFIVLPFTVNCQDVAPSNEIEKNIITQGLVDIRNLEKSIQVDLKYSSTDNFLNKDAYGDLEKCYLQKEPAEMLANAQRYLKELHPDYNLLVFDCVRPRSVQRVMWDIVKGTEFQQYVADPDKGSIHNYGAAVDLTIADEQGRELDMGTPFDYFGELAQPKMEDQFIKEGKLNPQQIENRKLLKTVMEKAGFKQLDFEWWHFNAFPSDEVKSRYKIIE